ncbi:MAG: 3-deoxy-manno-octulosonate cytidylyltransferase [Pirellulales bacterium]
MQSSSAQSLKVRLSSAVVIPARLHSSRLPKKLLLAETGKPLIQHTYEATLAASHPSSVIVATDHDSILQAVSGFGGTAKMTSESCASGTDRVAEIARDLSDIDVIVNVQGDEPEISGTAIDQLVNLLECNPSVSMATLATPIREKAKLEDPACVKVVCNEQNEALYFSRSMIPFAREWNDELLLQNPPLFLQHVGIYAYRRDFLLRLSETPVSTLETVENLEQLRVLSMGETIAVGVIDEPSIGIDTPEDYALFVSKTTS